MLTELYGWRCFFVAEILLWCCSNFAFGTVSMSLWCCLELLVGTIPQRVVFITLVWRFSCTDVQQANAVSFRVGAW